MLSIYGLFSRSSKPIACLLRCNCYAFAVQLHGSKGAKWCILAGNIIVFGTKTTVLRQKSSLLSSVRPIIFLQNKNVDGPFLGRFLVKKLDIFSLYATGEAYRFLRWCQSLYEPLFYKGAWRYRCMFKGKDDESKTTLTCVNHSQMTGRMMRCIEIFLLYLQ